MLALPSVFRRSTPPGCSLLNVPASQINPGEIVRIDDDGVHSIATVERTSRRAGRNRQEVADARVGEVVRLCLGLGLGRE